MARILTALLTCLSLLTACTRDPLTERVQAMRPHRAIPISDDLPVETLVAGMRENASLMERATAYPSPLVFGRTQIAPLRYAQALRHIIALAEKGADKAILLRAIGESFDVYESYGGQSWGDVLLTSYYEPIVPGSPFQQAEFEMPLLKKPGDLVEIRTERYDRRFSNIQRMRGRLARELSIAGNRQVVPYFTREEIVEKRALKGKGLELCWVNPVDGLSLQTQGSGTVAFADGRQMRLGYSDQNGHLFESLGKFVTESIPLERLTWLNLEAHLKALSTPDRNRLLNRNPSYVFFRPLTGEPVTSLGTQVVAGRTIATDGRYFPKGALAYLVFDRPYFEQADSVDPVKWERTSRLVLDTDTGGAIRGGGRVDLFWGRGAEAKQHASVMKSGARLYYLAPKASFLQQLNQPEEAR